MSELVGDVAKGILVKVVLARVYGRAGFLGSTRTGVHGEGEQRLVAGKRPVGVFIYYRRCLVVAGAERVVDIAARLVIVVVNEGLLRRRGIRSDLSPRRR